MKSARAGSGFTLIELLVVMAVIAALMAITMAGYGAIKHRQNVRVSQSAIDGLAQAMAGYQNMTALTTATATYLLWDVDSNGILDGDPDRDPGFSAGLRSMARSVGYKGASYHLSSADRVTDNSTGRPTDAWNTPIRVVISGDTYGGASISGHELGSNLIGLVSCGQDKTFDTADDLTSWHGSDIGE